MGAMKRLLVIACIVLISTGMKKRRYTLEPTPQVTIAPSPRVSISPRPVPSGRGYLTFAPVAYYSTQAERVKIKAGEAKVNQVIQSACFADFMLGRKLIQTDGRSRAQVVAHIQGMRDTVPVNMYYRKRTSAVAYRNEGEKDINLNRNYFTTDMDDCEWGATLTHEAMHSIGEYDHDYNWSPSRSYSVPYSVGGADQAQGGSAFDECCQ